MSECIECQAPTKAEELFCEACTKDQIRRGNVLTDVMKELSRQHEIWGQQNHDPITYSAIFGEECGEFCQAAVDCKFSGGEKSRMREEVIQVAAVAIAIAECLDRDIWSWNGKRAEKLEKLHRLISERKFEEAYEETIPF